MLDYAEMIRLHEQFTSLSAKLVAAGIPVVSVSRERLEYAADATPEQRAAGDAILSDWDWDAEPEPTECSPLQAVMALDAHGYLSSVEQVIDAMGLQDWRVPIAWNRATVVRIDSPLLQEVATYVPGLADALPAILRTAVQIQV